MGNSNLKRAIHARRDEFYTRLEDVERELNYYIEQFEGKIIYLNCDDPEFSAFWQYFSSNFEVFGLKKLMATHYVEGGTSRMTIIEKQYDANSPNIIRKDLNGDGDFRSEECIELLKDADIVATNPPFSLFREYMAQLVEYDKKFVILGNQNAFSYKDVFPLLKDNVVWTGYERGSMEFRIPDHYPEKSSTYIGGDGYKYQKIGTICWYTNLEVNKPREEQPLTRLYEGNEELYPMYDNYDAIEVGRLKDIPMDYDGVMGVPITYLNKHNLDHFEIIGITQGRKNFEDPRSWPSKIYTNGIQHNADGSAITSGSMNSAATILLEEEPEDAIYYTADNAEGPLKLTYTRILIINKRPVSREEFSEH